MYRFHSGTVQPRRAAWCPCVALILSLPLAGNIAAGALSAETLGAPAAASGLRLSEGDILTRATEPGAPMLRGVAIARDNIWRDGIVPVWIEPELLPGSGATIRDAIAGWNAVAGIRIDVLEQRPADGVDHVRFEPGDGCASWVGRRGGAQSLWVAPECNVGSVMHELGHALGLEHEHTRPDRDEWIAIRWDSVLPEKRHNFDRAPDDAPMLGEYDYASIMHYGPDFFSADGSATIAALRDTRARIGQRNAPSAGDIAAIAELYGTDLALRADLFGSVPASALNRDAAAPSHELDVHVSNDGRNGAHDIAVNVALSDDWLSIGTHLTSDDWHCVVDDTALECRLDRLAAGANAYLSIALRVQGMSGDGSTDDSADSSSAPLGSPLLVGVQSGSDDPDVTNDVAAVEAVLAGERSPQDIQALADGGSAGDEQAGVRTGMNGGIGATGHGWWALVLMLAARRLRRCRRLRPSH